MPIIYIFIDCFYVVGFASKFPTRFALSIQHGSEIYSEAVKNALLNIEATFSVADSV